MKTREFILHIIAIIVILTMAMALVWIKNEQIKLGYLYSKKFSEYRELKELNEKLYLEWEYLTDYSRLEKIARKEFKLKNPSSKDILYCRMPNSSHSQFAF